MKFKIIVTTLVVATLAMLKTTPLAQESAKGPSSVWGGVYTKEQSKRGEELYAQKCSSCHGPELGGNDEAAPLSGPIFLSNWDGLTVGDLSERVRISMPPNKLGTLTKQQIADSLSYVLKFNNFPEGKAELDSRVEVLKLIKIEASKPKTNSSL